MPEDDDGTVYHVSKHRLGYSLAEIRKVTRFCSWISWLWFFYATTAICVASSNEQTKSILMIREP